MATVDFLVHNKLQMRSLSATESSLNQIVAKE
jgi:hypothetical protein